MWVVVVIVIVLLIRGNVICWKTIERRRDRILELRKENIGLRIQCRRLLGEKIELNDELLKVKKNGEL